MNLPKIHQQGVRHLVHKAKTSWLIGALSLLLAMIAVSPTSAQAATFTWDASGANASNPTDGAGNWSTSNANWSNGSTDTVWSNAGNNAVFGDNNGAAGAVTVGSVTVGNITFNPPGSGSYTLNGGTITLNSSTVTTNASSATINSAFAGSGTLTVSGTGTLTLTNPYTGATTINGNLILDLSAKSGALNIGSNSVASSGTLTLLNTNPTVDSEYLNGAVFTGAGTIVKSGTGDLDIVSGNISGFTGTINVQAGILGVNALGANATAPQMTLNIASGAAFDDRNGSNLAMDKLIGSGTLGTSYLNPNTVSIGNNNGSSTFAGSIINSITSPGFNAGGTIAITKNGTGTLTLTGTNSYTGSTTVTGGTLQIGNGSSGSLSNSTAISVSTGTATLTFDEANGASQTQAIANSGTVVGAEGSGITNTLSGAITGGGGFTQSGAGETNLTSASTNFSGPTTINSGTLVLQNTTGFASTATVNSAGTLVLSNTGNGINNRGRVAALITGPGTLNINNPTPGINGGWVTFVSGFGLSAFTGTVNVNSGVLSMDGLNGVWSGNPELNVVSGGLFGLRGQSVSVDALTGNGDVFSNLAGTATLTVGAANGSGTFSGVIHGANSGAGDGTIEQGVLNLTKTGTGTEILTGSNTYIGATTINAGTLQIGNGGTTGSISSSSAVSGSSGATLAFNESGALIFSSAISGSLAVLQKGTGSTQLGSNTYTGSTTIQSGTLILNGNSTSDATGYTLGNSNSGASNVTLQLASGFSTGNETLPSGAGGARIIDVTVSGSAGGTNLINASSAGIHPDLYLVLNGPVTLRATGNELFTTISGTGAGAGNTSLTLDVNGGTFSWTSDGTANTFSGNVHIMNSSATAGSLEMENNSYISNVAADQNLMIPDTSSVQLDSNITWQLVWGSETIDALNGAGTIQTSTIGGATYLAGSPILTVGAGNGSGTFSGVMSDGGSAFSLGKSGTGTEILTGSNTYTGATTVSGGTLQIGNGSSGSLSNSTAISVSTGTATLTFDEANGASQTQAIANSGTVVGAEGSGITNTLSGAISGAGGFTQSGAGKTILTGTNTYNGPTTINSGTLEVGNGGTGSLSNSSAISVAAGAATLAFDEVNGASQTQNITDAGTVAGAEGSGITNTLSGAMSGAGGFTQSGAGVTILTATNTYSGGTTISSGTIQLGTTSGATTGISYALGTGGLTINGGALNLDDYNITILGAISGTSGTITDVAPGQAGFGSALTLTSGSYGGVIADGVSSGPLLGTGAPGGNEVIKSGAGVLALTGSNTYGYGTQLNSGTLQINNSSSLGTGADGNGYLNFNGGTLQLLASVGINNSQSITVTSGSNAIFDTNGYTLTEGDVISGNSGGLTKNGLGTLALTAQNTYTGATTVNSGTLNVARAGTAGNSTGGTLAGTAITVNTGGTLLVSASNAIGTSSTVTLAGGKFAVDPSSEGTGAKVVNGSLPGTGTNTPGMGALTLTANSTLDFTSTASTLVFGAFDPTNGGAGNFTLNVINYVNTDANITSQTSGIDGSDSRLIFDQGGTTGLTAGQLADITFSGVSNAGQINLGGGFFEVAPVPEPATILAGVLVLGFIGLRERKRMARLYRGVSGREA